MKFLLLQVVQHQSHYSHVFISMWLVSLLVVANSDLSVRWLLPTVIRQSAVSLFYRQWLIRLLFRYFYHQWLVRLLFRCFYHQWLVRLLVWLSLYWSVKSIRLYVYFCSRQLTIPSSISYFFCANCLIRKYRTSWFYLNRQAVSLRQFNSWFIVYIVIICYQYGLQCGEMMESLQSQQRQPWCRQQALYLLRWSLAVSRVIHSVQINSLPRAQHVCL